jgi:uncharacterized membrane protein YfhO
LAAIGLLVYRDFVFGGETLLYKDIGSDSVNIFFPYLVHLSGYIRSEGFPSWSFCVGMGQSLSHLAGYLVWQPLVWLPRALISHALVFQHLFKTIIAGLFFFRFLQLRGLNFPATLLGSLLLAFSSYMSMGACWYINADEVVAFAGLLAATEQSLQDGRRLWLALAVALIGLISAFHLYLCALFLSIYVPLRLAERFPRQPMSILRACLALALVAALGLGLAAVFILPNLYGLLHSPRVFGSTSSVSALSSSPVFGLQSPPYYFTAFVRPFANDILGAGSNFRGWRNYFEAPQSYCGLLSLILLPQVFIATTLRRKIIYALFFAGILIPIVFPWFRYLFWLFQGDYFRFFSLLSIFGIITLSMTAFSRYTEGHNLSLWLLGATTIALLGILYLPITDPQTLVDPTLRRAVAIFLILYAALLVAGQLLRRQNIVCWIILAMAAVELVYLNRGTVSDRPTVTKQELKERVGYNDQTVDAVRDLKSTDTTFFRMTKTWPSGPATLLSLNDALVFGFYGTASYSSFNNLNYINFLLAVGAISDPESEVDIRWSKGVLGRPLLSLFACEKYALANDPVPFQMSDQYEFVRRYGNIYLFRNKLFLPLGLAYHFYITEEIFLQLSSEEKSQALLHTVVLADRNEADKQGLAPLTIDELKQQIAHSSLPETVAARWSAALNLRDFSQTRLKGTTDLDQRTILVLQTPFDRGWRAYQDGQAIPVLKVDVGLLGVPMDRGQRNLELRYTPPFLREGAALTLVSFVILASCWWRSPRIRALS